jgi:hypothetical protein
MLKRAGHLEKSCHRITPILLNLFFFIWLGSTKVERVVHYLGIGPKQRFIKKLG